MPDVKERDQEREALEAVFNALEPLDEESRARVLAWILDRFRYGPAQDAPEEPGSGTASSG